MGLIMFIAGWVALFSGNFIVALLCWAVAHLLGRSR